VLLLIALAIAGCGRGSSTVATATSAGSTESTASVPAATTPAKPAPSQSKKQFITQADAICSHVNTELAAVSAKNASAKEVLRVVPQHVSLERTALVALEKLTPPSSLESNWQRILGYRRTLATELAQLVGDAQRNDSAALKRLGASKKLAHKNLNEIAVANGFKDCAKLG
jgi:hypothetical protein